VDLVIANWSSNKISVLLGNGDGSFQGVDQYPTGNGVFCVAVGDFNGDRILDLAVANSGTNNSTDPGSVSILLGNGDGTFQAAVNYAAGEAPFALAVGDFNGDGHADLVVANNGASRGMFGQDPALASGTVSVLLGNGDGTFQAPQNYAGANGKSVVVKDLNGDGIPDLAVVFSGGVRVLLGKGDGTFQTTPISYIAGAGPWRIATGDLNGDGLPDLAIADLNSSSGVSILINDGKWVP
jgi:hypothetical protein